MKLRSFLAFDITEELKTEFESVISLLSPKTKAVKWVDPKLMHCTMNFFGNVEEELLLGKLSQVIESNVKYQAPFSLVSRGIGAFPNWRYPRVVWAGLSGDSETAISLQKRLEDAFSEFGFPKDPRAFRLHLTLGRAKSAIKDSISLMQVVEKLADREFGEFTVKDIVLYRSDLTRNGPIYTALKRFALGGTK